MTENVKKIMAEVEKLSPREQAELRKALMRRRKKHGRNSVLDLIGIGDGGKALYTRLDRGSF